VSSTYSTTAVQSTVTSAVEGVDSSSASSESCSETSNIASSEYQPPISSLASSTSANAGEFTVLSSRSASIAPVDVTNLPRSTVSDVISLTTFNVNAPEVVGEPTVVQESDVISTENIVFTSTVVSSSTDLVLTSITLAPPFPTVVALATAKPGFVPAQSEVQDVAMDITLTATSSSTILELTTITLSP
jgi:hypothetical protein